MGMSDLFLWSLTFVYFPENAGNCDLSVTRHKGKSISRWKTPLGGMLSFLFIYDLQVLDRKWAWLRQGYFSLKNVSKHYWGEFWKQGSCSTVLSSPYLLLSIKLKNRTLFSFLLLCALVTTLNLLQHESGDWELHKNSQQAKKQNNYYILSAKMLTKSKLWQNSVIFAPVQFFSWKVALIFFMLLLFNVNIDFWRKLNVFERKTCSSKQLSTKYYENQSKTICNYSAIKFSVFKLNAN